MTKKLVIVESPAKAKTINRILGGDYVVKASMGHVRDLPVRTLGVDIEHGFEPKYEIVKGRDRVIRELTEAARGSAEVYLAPDPDREGEAIAWHLKELLEKVVPAERFHRVTYNEITPRAVREAFGHPGRIDQRLVDAQQARRVLDRIVGYRVSPLLWRRIRRGLSAGRVQSVALRLICEREQAIRAFVPEPYWLLGAKACKQTPPLDPFLLRLARIDGEKADVRDAETAARIRRELEGCSLVVADVTRKEVQRRPFPPFITSTLQQSASRALGMTPSRTMRIAQKLYEGVDFGEGPVGLITYMRTDSVAVSQDAVHAVRAFIEERLGREYLPEKPNVFKSRGGAQEAHEAIRPTEVLRTPEEVAKALSAEELKLYTLIWRRFVASQMAPARIEQRTVDVDAVPAQAGGAAYRFRASASQVVFSGYMKVSGMEKRSAEEGETGDEPVVDSLPPLERGERLECVEWTEDRKETQPPSRYNEASLIKALEEDGVGRPSTYAQILSTLYDREYVTREKKVLKPTDLGLQVNDLLTAHLAKLFDVKFTAGMEEKLDRIETGTVNWTAMLEEFYREFSGWMDAARETPADGEKMKRLLGLLESVKAWGPEQRRGRRIYSDKRFIESVRKQCEEGRRPLSERQLAAVARLVGKYRDQIPGAEQALHEMGFEAEAVRLPSPPPKPSTMRKLELLRDIAFEPAQTRRGRTYDDRAFVESLRQRAERNVALSPAQEHALNRIVLKYAEHIPDFERVRPELELEDSVGQDAESGPLLEALEGVSEWKPSVSKNGKTLDDKAFFESLKSQFARKGSLTPRQRAALARMARKYRVGVGAKKGQTGNDGDGKPSHDEVEHRP